MVSFRFIAALAATAVAAGAVLWCRRRLPSDAAVATIGAPSEPAHLRKLIRDVDAIERQGEAEVVIAGRPFRIKRQFLQDIERQRMRDVIGALRRPIMILGTRSTRRSSPGPCEAQRAS